MIKKIFLLSMLACILALTFISCSDDENSEYSKEGLWMVTSYKFVNYNLTQDKILVQGEYTYDLEFTRNKDYIYCNIFDIKSADEIDRFPADIYESQGFTSDNIMMWKKQSRHTTFFGSQRITSTNDGWDGYQIVSVTENTIKLTDHSTWTDFGENFSSSTEVVLTRISSIPGIVVDE